MFILEGDTDLFLLSHASKNLSDSDLSVEQQEIEELRKIQDRIDSNPDSLHKDASIDGYHPRLQMGRLLAEVVEVSLFSSVNSAGST